MKMRGHKNSVIITIASLLCLSMFSMLITQLFAIHDIAIDIDPLVSDTIQLNIQRTIHDSLKTQSMKSIVRALCEQYSCIKNITCSYAIAHTASLTIVARVPVYAANSTHIITEDGHWVMRSLYQPWAIRQLITVMVPPHFMHDVVMQEKINSALYKCVTSAVFTQYVLCIHDEMNFCLHDKENSTFSVVFNNTKIPDTTCLHQCQIIKEELKIKGELIKKQWIADVRFENQIILSRSSIACKRGLDAEKGGYHDGACIF